MVFFTCSYCGSALKKNKVEKHYAVECRQPVAVSCMDCLTDFFGQDYASHSKCLTEEQKYSGQPLDGKVRLGKGERKQIEWVETVKQIVETKGTSLTPQERNLLENLKEYENIPRKKKKFENFLKNAMGRYIDQRTIEKVWSLLEERKAEVANNKVAETKEILPSSTKEAEADRAGGKKKKDKINKEVSEEAKGTEEEGTQSEANGDVTSKKKEKHSACSAQGDSISEVVEEEGTKPEKNKKHTKTKNEHLEPDISASETSEEVIAGISRETEGIEDADQSSQKESPKLSKKEKKERKKRQKYELELESIENEKQAVENDKNQGEEDMELDQEETQDEGKVIKSKKGKKKKKDKVIEEANADGIVEAEIVNGLKGKDKKKGKRKHGANAEEEGGEKKKMKESIEEQDDGASGQDATKSDVDTVTNEDAKGKFKWDKTILAILQTVPDNELLVKRLRKKVLSEYQEALGKGRCQELSLEEAMGMFERKLHKIPGVKVLKDKAKLVKRS